MNKRIIDILTTAELKEIRNLKKCVLRAGSQEEIKYYRSKFNKVVQEAKDRYLN